MSDISEQEIQIFVDAVSHYFLQITQEKAEIKAAYLAQGTVMPPVFDFTGIINISGQYRGYIYFSAPRVILSRLLISMRESSFTDVQFLDSVGEIANTIAGNARKFFGEAMKVSVPINVKGVTDQIQNSTRARPYVITIKWKQYEAALVVDIERV